MINEQQDILNRVRLLMGYKSEKTLSENYSTIVKNFLSEEETPQQNTEGEKYNEGANKATFSNAKIVQEMYDNNTLTKEILKKFSCDIINTNFSDLVSVFEQVCRQLGVGPASDDIINYSGRNAINLVSWLLETQLVGNLTYWIQSKNLSDNTEKDAISKLIYVKSNGRTKVEKKVVDTELRKAKEAFEYEPIYKDIQTIEYDRKQYGPNDSEFNEYLKRLENQEIRLDPSDITIVNDIKKTINERFKVNEYPSAVRLCSALGVVSKEDDPEIQKQIDYALSNNCPAQTLEEENNFREWVNMNFPEIAKKLGLEPSTKEFCTTKVKTAAGYSINRNLIDKYDPTK